MGSKPVRELIINSLREDPELAEEVYNEAVLCLVRGESEVTRILLRDLIHATVGLEAMADAGSVGYLKVPLKSNGAR
jgi:hypothetical protein